MKSQFLLSLLTSMTLACVGHAQSLLWSYTPPTPIFSFDHAYSSPYVTSPQGADLAGGAVIIINYTENVAGGTQPVANRVVWLTSKGKTRWSVDFTASEIPAVFRVTPSSFILEVTTSSGRYLRKYQLRRTAITTTDTILSDTDTIPNDPNNDHFIDTNGFFVFHYDANGNIQEIRRYKN